MAGFRVQLFRGLRPRVSTRKLQPGEAQTAQNAKLGSGDLRAWFANDNVITVSDRWYNETVYRFDNDGSPIWFEWNSVVDVVRGPIKDDSLERTYFTGAGARPKMTFTTIADGGGGGPYPEATRDLGIPAPPVKLRSPNDRLPESVKASNRSLGTITCEAFIIDKVIFDAANYPGTGTDNQTWRLGDYGVGGGFQAATFVLNVSGETRFKVKRVISKTQVVLESAATPGIFARSEPSDVEYSDPFQEAYTATVRMDEQGSTKVTVFKGWVIPEATVTTAAVNHYLRAGDVIDLISVGNRSPGHMEFVVPVAQDFHEQSWDAEVEQPVNWGSGNTAHVTYNARVTPSATEGDNTFSIVGTFGYNISREESDSDFAQDRQYVYTYVSDLGEEGPPSPVSRTIDAFDGNLVNLLGFENVFTHPKLSNRTIDFFRIYRTSSTEAGTEFQFVKEVSVGTAALPTTTVADEVKDAGLGEVLDTTTWFPPVKNMAGLISLPNGVLVGFKGKTIYFSEPYFPHAWPPEYDQAVDFDIMGLANIGNSVVIMTKGHPYWASGSHPRSINIRPIKLNQACMNKESIATDKDRVYYASPDGLVEISANGAKVVTEAYVRKEEWAAYSPESMTAAFHDGKYFGFFDGPDNVTQPPVSAALTGTFVSAVPSESDIRAGGKTIIITLTGSHVWEDAGANFNSERQNIIDSFFSDGSEDNGWDAELSNVPVTDVVRTSATVVTITLSALATFNITEIEVLRCTLPASVFKSTQPADSIAADNALTITVNLTFSSRIMVFTGGGEYGYSDGDAEVLTLARPIPGDDTFNPPLIPSKFQDIIAYDTKRDRWVLATRFVVPGVVTPHLYVSDDDGATFSDNDVMAEAGTLTSGFPFISYYSEYDLYVASFGDHDTTEGKPAVMYSQDGAETWEKAFLDSPNNWDKVRGASAGFCFYNGFVYSSCYKTGGADEAKLLIGNASVPSSQWKAISINLPTSVTNNELESVAAGNGGVVYLWRTGSPYNLELGKYDPYLETSTAIGTITTGAGFSYYKIAFSGDHWMIVNTEFMMWHVSTTNETSIGSWIAAGEQVANITVRNLYYDPGDGATPGWGWVVVGINTSTGKAVIYTSDDDGSTWVNQAATADLTAEIYSMAFTGELLDQDKR